MVKNKKNQLYTKIKNKSSSEKNLPKQYTLKNKQIIYQLLEKKFKIIYRKYKFKNYKYSYDFYIKDLDLYIDYNEHITHGKEPYNPTNLKQQQLLDIWKEKAQTSKHYQNIVRVWTIKDPQKQEFADKNSLNYLKFYTLNEFIEWYDKLN